MGGAEAPAAGYRWTRPSVARPPAGNQRRVMAVANRCSLAVTCRNTTGRGRRFMSGSPVGSGTGPGLASWSRSRRGTTPSERWNGRRRWTPPSTARTSTRPAPGKGGGRERRAGRFGTLGGRPGAGPLPRRADHQSPSRLRRPGPAPGCRPHPRQRQRLHRVQSGAGICADASDRRRAAAAKTRHGHRGQGLLITGGPTGPAVPGHPRSHPGTDRPKGQPPAPRQSRWRTTGLRPRTLREHAMPKYTGRDCPSCAITP